MIRPILLVLSILGTLLLLVVMAASFAGPVSVLIVDHEDKLCRITCAHGWARLVTGRLAGSIHGMPSARALVWGSCNYEIKMGDPYLHAPTYLHVSGLGTGFDVLGTATKHMQSWCPGNPSEQSRPPLLGYRAHAIDKVVQFDWRDPRFLLMNLGSSGSLLTFREWHLCLWLGLPMLMAYPLIRLTVLIRQRRRLTKGLCAGCGYDLRGNQSGKCPECGTIVHHASGSDAGRETAIHSSQPHSQL